MKQEEQLTKRQIKAEIKRLQKLLEKIEEDELLNYPHKQLDLFEEN